MLILKDRFRNNSGHWTDIVTGNETPFTFAGGAKILEKVEDGETNKGMYLTEAIEGVRRLAFAMEFQAQATSQSQPALHLSMGIRKTTGIGGGEYAGALFNNFNAPNGSGRLTEWDQDLNVLEPTDLTLNESHLLECMILRNGKTLLAFDESEVALATPEMGLLPSFIGQPMHFFARVYYPGGKILFENFEVRTRRQLF